MAASSYYKLDPYPLSDPNAPSDLYSGNGYSKPKLRTVDMAQQQEAYPMHTNNTYNNQPAHPFDPPSKPLVQETSRQIPLKPPTTPNNRLRQRKYQKWKRALRICKIVTKVITILFSTIMFGIMVFMTVRYQATKDTDRGGRTAWPKDPKLWPTFMLLAGAGFTLLLSFVTLISYCCAFSKARRSWKLTIVKYVIHIGAWLVISTLYRYEKSLNGHNNDLWGWSCSDEADAIQTEFNGVVGFGSLCIIQTASSGVSYAEVAFKIIFAIGHFIIYRKTRDGEKQNLADGLGGGITDLVEDF